MYIWKLTRLDEVDYDQMSAVVVIADSESDARQLAGLARGSEAEAVWHAPTYTTCVCFGASNAEFSYGIVLRNHK